MPVEEVPHRMLAPQYQVSWAGKEDPNADDVTAMMPWLMIFNVFMAVGGYLIYRLCKERKVPFWEMMIAFWFVMREYLLV